MSLLTDEEMLGVFTSYDSDFDYVGGTEGDLAWKVAKAQHAKTLKAVAEWLGTYCDNPKHESQAKRIACIRCLWELQDAGTFGKMPGEE